MKSELMIVLEFIFSDFWHWAGMTVILTVVFGSITQIRGLLSYANKEYFENHKGD